ncbi:MAG: hypothetical protein JWN22_1032 [Nocardioides sp.]|jgi:hypothetical protein|nr:hypothetical protein [Nocardioides sp.]
MTEDRDLHGTDQAADEPTATERVRTGVDDVDAVLAAVEQLEDRPVEEHVGVFEGAHEQLRRALDHQPGPPGPS